MIDDARFREVYNRVEALIEKRYAVPVRIADVPNPFTGDLDGAEIHVDFENEIGEAVFLLAHLFGHTVQWNLSERARVINDVVRADPTGANLDELEAYELEACAYSLQLFHEANVHDLDQWVSDYAACDFRYLRHFYSTGEQRVFKSFWQEGSPLVAPKAIPHFQPQRWVTRMSGIVV